jgi:hypothetical protein
VEDACLAGVEELLLEGNPKLLSGAIVGVIGLLEVDGDGVVQPWQDHAVHLTSMGLVEGRSVRGDVVIEDVALERQQHEVAPTWVLDGCDVEDNIHQGSDVLDADNVSVEIADGGSLKHASYGGCWAWCCRWCWCYSGSKMRWRWWSDSKDVDELELEGGLLGLGLGGGNAHLKGCEGSDEVSRSGGGSRGGGSLLLLWHSLDSGSMLTGGSGRDLDHGDGRSQVGQSDGVSVDGWLSHHDEGDLGRSGSK